MLGSGKGWALDREAVQASNSGTNFSPPRGQNFGGDDMTSIAAFTPTIDPRSRSIVGQAPAGVFLTDQLGSFDPWH
jgi:hypothetical protein